MRRDERSSAQRWASILVGAAVLALAAWMTAEAPSMRPPKPVTEAGVAEAGAVATPDAGVATATDDLDAGFSLTQLLLTDAATMPSSAPRSVKIGVLLVTFAGAEGAPATARSKAEARTIAERLAGDAHSDFSHAISGGDPGSSPDIGRIPRGVLDPRTEVSVFALAAGEVSDVLETPKGYWIVKRIE